MKPSLKEQILTYAFILLVWPAYIGGVYLLFRLLMWVANRQTIP